ncbi:MAG: hypothetical protein PHP03_03665 [Candidatus Pacebacteria bacterium]|nr:hypothetical protein [Candidatus Paceibacterota bacterium]
MNFKKKYNLYFHNDFDGMASGAIMLNFLKSKGGDIRNFFPVNHPMSHEKWVSFKLKKPAIIFDFFYHPDAEIWTDHHQTTFVKKEWQKKFKNGKLRQWNFKSPSNSEFLINHLRKNLGFKPAPFIKELAEWADIIDSAGYKSVKQVFDLRIPAKQICFAQDEDYSAGFMKFLIKELSQKSMKKVANLPKVKKLVKRYKNKFSSSIKYFKNNFEVIGKTGFLKIEKERLIDYHFISYYFDRNIYFSVDLIKRRGFFKLHADINPWHKPKSYKKIDIGKFMRENYDGGGHAGVGAAMIRGEGRAFKAAQEVIKYLNNF